MKRHLIALGILMFCVTSAAAEPSLTGHWARGDGKAVVRIEPCGSELCAVNTWILPNTKDEHVGDRLIMNVQKEGATAYSGTANDPQRNLSYSLRIDIADQKMTTRGCVLLGLLCKDMAWSRVAPPR